MGKKFEKSVTVDSIIKNYQTGDSIEKELAKDGLFMPPAPRDAKGNVRVPELPDDISAVSDDNLGKLFTEFTSYADYISTAEARVDLDRAEKNAIRDAILAKLRYQKDGSSVDRGDQAKTDPQFLKADSDYLKAECKFKLAKAIMSRFNRDLRLISRELTRRGLQQEIQNSQASMAASRYLRPPQTLGVHARIAASKSVPAPQQGSGRESM